MAPYANDRSIVLVSKHDATPQESWWLEANGSFYDRAHQEFPRMRQSRFASIQLGTDLDFKADRRRRLPV